MQAMLLAAGLGTRLRPYSLVRPKPLFPVLNRPLLFYLLDMLGGAGSELTVVNGHHLWQQIGDSLDRYPAARFQFEPEILGTGGSLREALPQFSDDPVLVMNGDIYHKVDLKGLYNYHRKSGNLVTMALHDYHRFNTVTVHDGQVLSFSSGENEPKGTRLAFTGIHVVEPTVIARIPANRFFHIIDLYEELAAKNGGIGYQRVDGSYWRDIGTPEDYLALHGDLLGGEAVGYGEESSWLVSEDALVDATVSLEGWGCIGRAEIGPRVRLKDCVVWDDAVVPADTSVENAIITRSHSGPGNRTGPTE